MYINLHNGVGRRQSPYDTATQGWVVLSMSAEGRFSMDFDATSLGNGCSPRSHFTSEDGSAPAVGPAVDRQQSGSVRPVLEDIAIAQHPADHRRLEPGYPGVKNMVVRPLHHRDGVDLHIPHVVDGSACPRQTTPKGLSLQQPLSAQGKATQSRQIPWPSNFNHGHTARYCRCSGQSGGSGARLALAACRT
jgi:hypothetical protein